MNDDLIKRLRDAAGGGQSSGGPRCIYTAAASALEAAKRENDRLRRQVEAAEALHGCCLDCYQPTGECNCCRADMMEAASFSAGYEAAEASAKRENGILRAMIRVNAMRDHGMSHAEIDAAIAAALATDQKGGE